MKFIAEEKGATAKEYAGGGQRMGVYSRFAAIDVNCMVSGVNLNFKVHILGDIPTETVREIRFEDSSHPEKSFQNVGDAINAMSKLLSK